MTPPSRAERLSQFETATDHESGANVVLSSQIHMLSGGGHLVGGAATEMCHPCDTLMIHVSAARAQRGDVGVGGEVLTVAAQAKGIAGLVLDGSVRDLASIQPHGFPVFARGVAHKGTGKAGIATVSETFSWGRQPVSFRDIVADESGTVVISPDNVEPALARTEEHTRAEARMMRELRNGLAAMELLGLQSRFGHG